MKKLQDVNATAADQRPIGKTFTFTDPEIIKIAEALSDARLAGRVHGGDTITADVKAMLKEDAAFINLFGFTNRDAMETAYIIRRSLDNPLAVHRIMKWAFAVEEVQRKKARQTGEK